MAASDAKATTDVKPVVKPLEINLFGYIQGVVYLNSEISDGAFQLGVTEEKLDGTQVAGPPVNEARFGPSERMRPETGGI